MASKQKNSSFVFFNLNILAIVFSLAVVFLFRPAGVFAQTASTGGSCNQNGDCSLGLFCSSQSNFTCQPIVAGTACGSTADCAPQKTGLVCDSGSGRCIQNTGSSTQNPSQYPIGSPKTPGNCGPTDAAIIKQIQSKLGISQSGVCDVGTQQAIQQYQQSQGITDDGIVGSNTATSMGISLTGTSGTSGTGGSTATQGSCPTGLVPVNGLCLPPNNTACTNGVCDSNSLTDLLVKIITLLLSVAGIIAVLMLIVGGFWYITSAGNEEQAEKGRKAIINSIIGVIVVLLSYAIITVISNVITKGT